MTDDVENVELEESTDPAPPMEELPSEESAPAEEPGADEAPPSESEAGESASVEVISVDELLERLTSSSESAEPEEGEEVSEPDEEAEGEPVLEEAEPEEALPSVLEVTGEGGGPLVVQNMEVAAQSLEALQETALHPALTTPFEDYTVTEALLLLILLAVFLSACAKLLRGAFTWLRS